MHLVQLDVNNFLSIGHATLTLEHQGLVHVDGENRDEPSSASNGAGKSSLCTDSLLWCLFGVTSRGVEADAVVNKQVGKNTEVTALFDIGGSRYQVSRFRKHKEEGNKIRVWKDDTEITRATSALTNQIIESIIGMNAQTFMHSVALGQGLNRRLTQLTDTERKRVLEGVLGIEVFDRVKKRTRDMRREEEAKKPRVAATQEALVSTIDSVELRQQQEVAQRSVDFDAQIDALKAERNGHEATELMQNQYVSIARAAQDEHKAEIAQCEDAIRQLDAAHAHVVEDTEKLATGAIAALRTRREAHLTLLAEQQAQLRRLHTERDLKQRALAPLDRAVGAAGAALTLAQRAAEIAKQSACPTCRRPIVGSEEQARVLDLFAKDIDEAKRKQQAAGVEVEAARAELAKAQAEIETLTRAAQETADTSAALLQEMAEAKKPFLAHIDASAARVKQEKAPFEAHLAAAHHALTEEVRAAAAAEASARAARDNIARTDRKIQGVEAQRAEVAKQQQRDFAAEIDDLMTQLGQKQAEAEAIDTKIARLDVVTQLYDRMRTIALADSLAFLNARTAYYSAILTDGRISASFNATSQTAGGEVRDVIGLQVTTAGGAYESASGGEADRIDLAISFALHDLVCRVATTKHNVLVVDEPANAVDPVGIRRIVDLLQAKLGDKQSGLETVIVVSQNPVFKGSLDMTWTVVKEGGLSRLETM